MFRLLVRFGVWSAACAASVGLVGELRTPALAATVSTGSSVISYNPGTLTSAYAYSSSSWTSGPAIGLPATTEGGYDTGFGPDDSVITPFNAQYNPANIVGFSGGGGAIEFKLSQPIATNGYTLSVQSAIGLWDSNGSGQNLATAAYYSNPQNATVLVSQDGTAGSWKSLGDVSFSIPTNVYADISGPYTDMPGSVLADFAKPFTGTLASFNGENFEQTLATLNGSGGGTWLDLSRTGLSEVNYVMLETDADQMSDEADEAMYVNAITGIAVPEPVSISGGALLLLVLGRRVGRSNRSPIVAE